MPWPFNDAGEPMCTADQYRLDQEYDDEPDHDDRAVERGEAEYEYMAELLGEPLNHRVHEALDFMQEESYPTVREAADAFLDMIREEEE